MPAQPVTSTTHETVTLGGLQLDLAFPDRTSQVWIGQREVLEQLLACWLTVCPEDMPLTPRLVGLPGLGKTTLAMSAAKLRNQPLYIFQCTADTRPEDLLITPVLSEKGAIRYHASPLVSAMLKGGICVLDEGNRMNEKSWASLASLLDHRRYVESIVAGMSIAAHPDFRCAVTMNEDESTYEIPDYILSRLQPTLKIGFPDRADELAILKYHLPFAKEEMLGLTIDFLQKSHSLDLSYSVRDGMNVLRFAIKRMMQAGDHPIAKDKLWRQSLEMVLGEEALDLERQAKERRRMLGAQQIPTGLAEYFFGDDDPLNPEDTDSELETDPDDDDA